MKFWDREKEKRWLKHYLLTEPNAILFVYGPKSSGKTTLLMKVVEELPKEKFIYYWFDLREELISDYESVVQLFFAPKGWLKEMVSMIKPKINLGIFEIEPHVLEEIKRKERKPFVEMRKRLEEDKAKGLTPVIVFDELQKLKDIYLNGGSQRPLIKELFNFFVRLTKVLHLSHVIVMTSDTFFIEQVYTDSTLVNTSVFYRVDYFDDKTTKNILISEGFNGKEADRFTKIVGGVPWMMERILTYEDIEEGLNDMYRIIKGSFGELLGDIYTQGWYKEAKRVLEKLIGGEDIKVRGEDRETVKKLVELEVLYYDPLDGDLRFQTKLHERAARELLEVE